ncbi:MAG: RagB/SusD family nutrient uptake outer membrane protein [Bacteroidota bacterium]|nr:RagB/SusD family nutrient uptake outer membrane protein [Bacteroidota bacterium]
MKQRYLKYKQAFLLGMLVISISACKHDSFLDVPPKGFLTDAATFSSSSNADLFVNDIYNQLPDINNEYQLSEQYADNSFCGAAWENGQSTVRSGSINPSNVPFGPSNMWSWEGNYTAIRKCNVFLQQAEKNKANFPAAWYTLRVAEVTYLRAFFYMQLFESYGGVPIIKIPLNNTTQGDAIFYARNSIDETVAFIEADCDAAAAALPLTVQDADRGRATKGAALTLKGWVELFAASPLVNTNNDVTKWAKAAATNKQVMDLNTYSLFSIDTAAYAEQFLTKNNWNSETIFAKAYALPAKGSHREGYLGPVYVNGVQESWGNLAPTQGLVDDYAMDNGLPITDPASGYDDTHPYTHRESRFYQSIIFDGSPWQGDIFKSRTGGSNQIDLGSTSDITNTGYNARKTLDESILGQASIASPPPSSANYIFYRYAEVLLSYAEAQNEAVGPDASVYTAVNAVRARSNCPAVKPGLSQALMRDYIHRERRIELAFEDKRWFDIRRWKITSGPTGVLNTPEYGMQVTIEAGTGKLIYTRVKIFTNAYKDYQNWMPIPQSDRDKNPKLEQNPGY